MLTVPIIGIFILILIYLYLIQIYRRVVTPASKANLKDYIDIDIYHQNIWDEHPNYIEPNYIQENKWDDLQNIGYSSINRNINL